VSEACWQTAFDRNASVATWQERKLIYVATTRNVIRARAGSKVRNFTAQYQKLRHRRTFASELLSGWKQPWRAEKHKQTEQVLLLIREQLVIISIEKPSRQCVSVLNADNQEDGVLGGSSSSSRRGRRLTLKSGKTPLIMDLLRMCTTTQVQPFHQCIFSHAGRLITH